MPFYDFLNPHTGEVRALFFHMKDDKVFLENGQKWERLWNKAPNAQVDSKIDPNNPKDFLRYTSSHSGTLGNVWDLSQELANKRGGVTGQDEVKEKHYQKYSKRRRGIKHPDVTKRESRERLKKLGVSIED